MRGPAVHPIVIAAGGTGGHFFPPRRWRANCIARGQRVALMTDARSGGLQSPVFAGLEQFVISGAGIAGRGAVRGGKAMLRAGGRRGAGARASWRAAMPAAVVGFGGYPCVAPVLATRLMRHRPTVILHEQNAVLGRANRFLARHADLLALSFAATERVPESAATVVTGNPVRPAIAALAASALCAADATRCACWCWAARSARACSATSCRRRWQRLPDAAAGAARRRAAVPRRGSGAGARGV